MTNTKISFDSQAVASCRGQFCDYKPLVILEGPDGREVVRLAGQWATHAGAVRAARKEVRDNPAEYRAG